MNPPGPILVGHLFPELRQHLLSLLRSLAPEDWLRPTSAGKWNVKDVASHILGGDIGNLSRRRDTYDPRQTPISGWDELVQYINQINASWVEAAQRISPPLLCDLLAYVGAQVDQYFLSLDPFAFSSPVSWAGSEPAPQWLDVAREYTERWHHQQQIRDATGREGLYDQHLFAPVLDAFVRALPHTFREVAASSGAVVQLTLSGEGGGQWALRRGSAGWELLVGKADHPEAEVTIAAQDAWKIFTRGLRGDAAMRCAQIRGESRLGAKILDMVSVIA
jgi:uncharacterized protein (TIGR03083 family)